ncbi:MAG TPA: hypothetical protein VFK48_03405 [Usitatibacter sp.]|nr:hypothetical protein [Usitatibacter sp.]
MKQHAGITRTVSDRRRARTLAGSLAFILAGAFFYSQNVRAGECGAHSDFLVASDRLLASVRPADCSRVFHGTADFAWPATEGAAGYTVALTFPDGHVETADTATAWLAWPVALPAGDYSWTVTVSGRTRMSSSPRSFTVDAAGGAVSQRISIRSNNNDSSTPHPSDSIGSITLATTAPGRAPAQGEITATRRKAGAAVAMATAWTSPRARAEAHSNNWDAARRECVDVPGAVATAALPSSLS